MQYDVRVSLDICCGCENSVPEVAWTYIIVIKQTKIATVNLCAAAARRTIIKWTVSRLAKRDLVTLSVNSLSLVQSFAVPCGPCKLSPSQLRGQQALNTAMHIRERERLICQVHQWQQQTFLNIKWQAAREAYAYLCWMPMTIKINLTGITKEKTCIQTNTVQSACAGNTSENKWLF